MPTVGFIQFIRPNTLLQELHTNIPGRGLIWLGWTVGKTVEETRGYQRKTEKLKEESRNDSDTA